MAQETIMLHNRYMLAGDNVAKYNSGAVAVVFDILTNRTLKVINDNGVAYVGKVESTTQAFTRVFGCNTLHTLSNAYLSLTQAEQKEIIGFIKNAKKENGKRSISYTCYRSSGAKSDDLKQNSKGENIKHTYTKEEQKALGLLNEIMVLIDYYGEIDNINDLYNGACDKWHYSVMEQKATATFEKACKLEDMQ